MESLFGSLADLAREGHTTETLLTHVAGPASLTEIHEMTKGLDALLRDQETWYRLLGKDGPTRILVLNQNSDELRAGGGFPGTAFLIEFDQGKMTHFSFQDIYTLDWHLHGYRPSPEGINHFRSLDFPGKPVEFEIRDANYYPLFHESAVKLDALSQEA